MIRFWAFSLFRGLAGIAAIALGVIATAIVATAFPVGPLDGFGPRQWLDLSAVAATYLLPFALYSFALWPRLWPISAAAIGWLAIQQAVVATSIVSNGKRR